MRTVTLSVGTGAQPPEDQSQRAESSVDYIGHETSSLGKEQGGKTWGKRIKAEASQDDDSHPGAWYCALEGWSGGSCCVSHWETCDNIVRNTSAKKGREGDCYQNSSHLNPSLSSLGRGAVFLPRLVL